MDTFAENGDTPLASNNYPAKASTARLKGMRAALADLEKGILKQREYPPMPYSVEMMDFIKLLRADCGVEREVINLPPGVTAMSQETASEAEGYNDLMRTEIEHRFGRDIFEKLQKKAIAK